MLLEVFFALELLLELVLLDVLFDAEELLLDVDVEVDFELDLGAGLVSDRYLLPTQAVVPLACRNSILENDSPRSITSTACP